MKTRVLSTLAIMLIVLTSAMAGVKEEVGSYDLTEAGKLLEKKITYPYLAQDRGIEGFVAFELKANADQSIEFRSIASDQPILSASVEKQVSRLNKELAKVMEPGTSMKVKLYFDL
jgi:outer membrane biosynthesis protein TonB